MLATFATGALVARRAYMAPLDFVGHAATFAYILVTFRVSRGLRSVPRAAPLLLTRHVATFA